MILGSFFLAYLPFEKSNPDLVLKKNALGTSNQKQTFEKWRKDVFSTKNISFVNVIDAGNLGEKVRPM